MTALSANPGLSKFIAAVMDPLPTATLTDTAYNSTMRQVRHEKWRKAERIVRFYRALYDAAVVWAFDFDQSRHPGIALPSHLILLDRYREAVAALLLTPAPNQAAMMWKRRQCLTYLPVKPEAVEKAVAADAAFLAAHPTTREPRRQRRTKGCGNG